MGGESGSTGMEGIMRIARRALSKWLMLKMESLV
jgi:hypothetical protein